MIKSINKSIIKYQYLNALCQLIITSVDIGFFLYLGRLTFAGKASYYVKTGVQDDILEYLVILNGSKCSYFK